MRITAHWSVSDARYKELQAMNKRDLEKAIKSKVTLGGITKVLADAKLAKIVKEIKHDAAPIKRKVKKADVIKPAEESQSDNNEGQENTSAKD